MSTERFVAAGDFHYGWEKKDGCLKPIHNQRAIDLMLDFCRDFEPHRVYIMGDIVDCGEISHWNRSKKHSTEGLRLARSIEEARQRLFEPLDEILPPGCDKKLVWGNHDNWILDVVEDYPGLAGLLDLDKSLGLTANGWDVRPMGTVLKAGKLNLMHGETTTGKHYDYQAVVDYEGSCRIWHHHTYKATAKRSAADASQVKTGIGVPGLCNRSPNYKKKAPNNWMHGFLWGEVAKNGNFTDTVTVITDKGFYLNGKHYGGKS